MSPRRVRTAAHMPPHPVVRSTDSGQGGVRTTCYRPTAPRISRSPRRSRVEYLVGAASRARLRAATSADEEQHRSASIRELARERIAPRASEIDKSSGCRDVVELSASMASRRLHDEYYGGLVASGDYPGAIEEVSRSCNEWLILAWRSSARLASSRRHGEQRSRYLRTGLRCIARRLCADRARFGSDSAASGRMLGSTSLY